ncbi:MAG: hypothetical protein AAF585_05205, partial [Verrucomicrobiota bacterium]
MPFFHKLIPATPWIRYAAIIFLGAIAHVFVLQADFYLDDGMHIIGHPVIEHGTWWEKTFRWIPYLIWSGVYKLFGTAAPAYHALTFATHLTIACLIYPIGRQLLTVAKVLPQEMDRELAPWIGALIFVCHPITSEPVHYARCLMIDLVALFTLMTVWRALVFTQAPNWRNAVLLAVVMILGVSSKQPGIGHVSLSAAIVIGAFGSWRRWRSQIDLKNWKHASATSVAALGLILILTQWFERGAQALAHPQLLDHALTQSRVFWEYAQRIVLPINLSVDHYIAWTATWRDPAAIISALALAGVVGIAAWMLKTRRWRLAGVLLCLALAQILIRFGYVIGELMVEYRLYPAMPFIALGAGCGLVVLIRKQRLAGIAATLVVLLGFTALTTERSGLWTDSGLIAANAAEQYPLNLRAWGSMQYAAALDNHPNRVLELKEQADAAFYGTLAYNREHPNRGYDISRLHLWYATFLQHCAYAKTKLDGIDAGANYSQQLLNQMIEEFPEWYLVDRQHPNPLVVSKYSLAREVYAHALADYTGRVTVPILFDRQTKSIVNNESREIIRLLDHEFAEFGNESNFHPPELRA